MDMLSLSKRITILAQLGDLLTTAEDEYLQAVMQRSAYHNAWFTSENQQLAMQKLGSLLSVDTLEKASTSPEDRYRFLAAENTRHIAVIFGGRYPLDGLADWAMAFLWGKKISVKLHQDDPFLFPAILRQLNIWSSEAAATTQVVDQFQAVDAIVGMVPKKSRPAFERYFGELSLALKTEQRRVAVLAETTSAEQLAELGRSVFDYFGLAPTSVGKIFVPKGYDFTPLLEALHSYRDIIHHSKYKNNFDYNYSLAILNKETFLANGCIILFESPELFSRIVTLHYSFYSDLSEVEAAIAELGEDCSAVMYLL